jgi:ribosomal protein L37AE/L43A
MNDTWQDRERGLEEGYFYQKDNELIAKMKARLAATAGELNCPKCDGKLHTGSFETVQVDMCDKCGGVWLDAGELQQIMHKENQGWFSRLFG